MRCDLFEQWARKAAIPERKLTVWEWMNERNALVAGPGTLPGKLPLAGAAAKAIAPPKVSPIGGKVLTNEERAELDRLTAKFEAHDLTLSERVRYYMLLGYDQARATELAGL